jgi:SAM-dependent methyltransferase
VRSGARPADKAEDLVGEEAQLDDVFDVVAGFNSFFFAPDPVEARREAGRVSKPGAPVVIQVWGRHERCDLEAMKAVVRPFMPQRPAEAPPDPDLSVPGVLERLAAEAGLEPQRAFDLRRAYEFANDEELGRTMLAPAGIAELVGREREESVRSQIVTALASFRTAQGSYRLHNEFHFVIASAGGPTPTLRRHAGAGTNRATRGRRRRRP